MRWLWGLSSKFMGDVVKVETYCPLMSQVLSIYRSNNVSFFTSRPERRLSGSLLRKFPDDVFIQKDKYLEAYFG